MTGESWISAPLPPAAGFQVVYTQVARQIASVGARWCDQGLEPALRARPDRLNNVRLFGFIQTVFKSIAL